MHDEPVIAAVICKYPDGQIYKQVVGDLIRALAAAHTQSSVHLTRPT